MTPARARTFTLANVAAVMSGLGNRFLIPLPHSTAGGPLGRWVAVVEYVGRRTRPTVDRYPKSRNLVEFGILRVGDRRLGVSRRGQEERSTFKVSGHPGAVQPAALGPSARSQPRSCGRSNGKMARPTASPAGYR